MYGWMIRRALFASVFVGQFWNGQIQEQLAVYMIVLGVICLAGWVRECRAYARSARAAR